MDRIILIFSVLIRFTFGQSGYCDFQLDTPSGEISSPNYPNNYYDNQNCKWLIMTTPRHKIRMVFHDFKLESSDTCAYDSTTVYDGTNSDAPVLGIFCGFKIPLPIQSSGSKMYVVFKTDSGVVNKGFSATYTTEGNCTYDIKINNTGQITSPNFPNNYTDMEDCAWLFSSVEGRGIELDFNTFDLQPDNECANDWVTIYDGNSTKSTTLGKFCGSNLPQPIQSTSNKVLMMFHSDDSVQGQGFNVTYKTGKCFRRITSSTGEVTSPNYPDDYPSMDECEWLFDVGYYRNKIKLVFDTFELQSDSDCSLDSVSIYDGNSSEARLLGKFCGNQLPHPAISSGPTMLLVFKSDGSVQANGFKAEYTSGTCMHQFTELFGEITSPNYPYPYYSHADCEWLLTTTPGRTFNLSFESFDTEGTSPCGLDWIAIYDGYSRTSSMLGKFCGRSLPSPISSSGNGLYLWFKTDGSVQKSGFKITYTTEGDCTFHITSGFGEITSPDYPNNYTSDKNCAWFITTLHERTIRLDFNTFQLQPDEECASDWIAIYDGKSHLSPLLGKFCGSELPAPVQSSGNNMFVIFRSDGELEGRGFNATHRAEGICRYNLTSYMGDVKSPFYPDNYLSMEDCSWLFIASTGKTIRLDFDTFDLQPGDECEYDWIAIYDGNSTESPMLGKFCGNEVPHPIISSSNMMLMVFHSDDSFQARGFEGKYRTSNCMYYVGNPFGNITSPNYPANYPTSVDCEWLISTTPGHVIKMDFQQFEMYGNEQCGGDWVSIYDGYDTESSRLGQFCGSELPQPVLSSDNIMYMVFKSDYSGNGKGFKAIHTTEGNCTFQTTSNYGEISSPNYPDNYPKMQHCAWLFSTSPQRIITLVFQRFDLQSSNGCENDWIAIYDGNSKYSPLLGKFCSNVLPTPLVSSGTKMFMVFKSDDSVQRQGFKATYRAEGKCIHKITADAAEISSPYYPNDYSESESCEWGFSTSSGKKMILNFHSFDLEFSEDCSHDWIAIYDGNNTDSELLGKYCGSALPPPIMSSGNSMYMMFKSDSSEERKGFEAKYNAGSCIHHTKSATGEIEISKSAYSHYNGMDCTWIITTDPGLVIKLTFNQFDLASSEACVSHYVAIYDGYHTNNSILLGKYCGRDMPNLLISSDNKMRVVFKSEYSSLNNGFKATYTTGSCMYSTTNPDGEITSPDFPDTYPSMQDCSWVIYTNPGQIINLVFNEFRLERSKQCMHDWVAIYDGYFTESRMLGKFCDTKLPRPILSSGNRILIVFKSDGAVQRGGFNITYTTADCYFEINTPFGEINSPNYPDQYNDNTICKWRFVTTPGHKIKLDFEDIDMEENYECGRDSITIYDGECNESPQVGKFCRLQNINYVFSTGNSLCVKFISDGSVRKKGFRAKHSTVGTCTYEITNSFGMVSSPNFPRNYPNVAECAWLFVASPGYTIKLDFNILELEFSEECEFDSIAIYDGDWIDSPLLDLFCGSETPQPVISSGNKMYMEFKSSDPDQGFQAEYTTGDCMYSVTIPSGEITSPDYPDDYSSMESCEWLISTTPGEVIKLEFHNFELQHDEDCDKDWIAIFDGDNTESPMLGKFCGRELPHTIQSSDNRMYIVFKSDGSIQEQGFSAIHSTASPAVSTEIIAGAAVGVILFIAVLVIAVYLARRKSNKCLVGKFITLIERNTDSQKSYNYKWWKGKPESEEASLCGH